MKIIFMGTPDFSVPGLEALVEAGHEIVLAVTQPDKQKGRGKSVQFPPVKETALRYNIPVIQPERIREPQWIQVLSEYEADIAVVIAFGQILPKEILDMPRLGCINVHASLLPKYRGASPIQQSILDGEKETGVTIQQMAEGVDTGDIISKVVVPIGEKETGGSLFDKLAEEGAKLLVATLEVFEQGTVTFEKQDESKASRVGMIRKNMGQIDFTQPAAVIERLIRGLNPWPSAYTTIHGKTLKLWEAKVVPKAEDAVPGQVQQVGKHTFVIAAGEDALEIESLQLEGKKRMDTESFLRGYSIQKGQMLGEQAEA